MELPMANGELEAFTGSFSPRSVLPSSASSVSSSSASFSTAYRPLHVEDLRSVSVLHPSRFHAPFGAAGSRSHRVYGTVAAGKATGAVVSCAFLPLDDAVVQALTAAGERAPTRGGVARKRKGEGSRAAEAAATARAAASVAGYDQPKGRNRGAAATGAIVARMGLMAAGTRVNFLDLQQKEVVAHYSAIKDYVRCVSCRSDGKLFAVSDDTGLLQIVQTDTRQLLRRLKGHTGPTRGCCFASDKTRVVSVGDDTTVRWWELSTGECTRIFTGHTDAVRSVDAPRDFFAAPEKSSPSADAGAPGGSAAAAAAASCCFTGSYDCTARLWDSRAADEGSCVLKHERPVEYVRFVDCVASAPLLLSCSANEVRLWDLRQTGRSICAVSSHVKTVTAARVVPGSFATAAAAAVVFSSRNSSSSSTGGRKRARREAGEVDGEEEEEADAEKETKDEEDDDEEEDSDDDDEEEESDEEEEEEGDAGLKEEKEDLRRELVVASTSLDGTLKLTSLRTLQVRHTLTFPGEVLSLDFAMASSPDSSALSSSSSSLSSSRRKKRRNRVAAAFLVGCADGSWVVRQRSRNSSSSRTAVAAGAAAAAGGYRNGAAEVQQGNEEAGEDVAAGSAGKGLALVASAKRRRKLLLRMRANHAHYFTRGRSALPLPNDLVVDGALGRRHGRLDRLLRSFQYQAALDISIATSPQPVVVALVAELLQRGGLEAAVRGRDAESVLPMLQFISRNITMKGGCATLLVAELAMALLQECEEWMTAAGSDPHLLELLKRIAQKIAFELDQIRQMDRLYSLLDSLLAI